MLSCAAMIAGLPSWTSSNRPRNTKPGCANSSRTSLSKRTSQKKHEKMADGRVPVPARDLLALGGDDPTIPVPSSKMARRCWRSAISMSENFGTWRDAEGRLIWGVNDFDEAARMPYALDIVRLATSAVLAEVRGISRQDDLRQHSGRAIARASPTRSRSCSTASTRTCVASSSCRDAERTEFWKKFDPEGDQEGPAKERRGRRSRRRYICKVLRHARPDKRVRCSLLRADRRHRQPRAPALLRHRHVAGRSDRARGESDGSLGLGAGAWRLAQTALRGDRVGRAIAPPIRPIACAATCWCAGFRRTISRSKPRKRTTRERRRKHKEQENPKAVERPELVNAAVLHAMGRDLAAIHRATDGAGRNSGEPRNGANPAGWSPR